MREYVVASFFIIIILFLLLVLLCWLWKYCQILHGELLQKHMGLIKMQNNIYYFTFIGSESHVCMPVNFVQGKLSLALLLVTEVEIIL